MTNPYQAPEGPTDNRLKQMSAPSTYAGGIVSILLLGVVAGTIAALLILPSLDLMDRSTSVPAFAAPAIVWIGTILALMLMLRGAQVPMARKIWLSFLVAIPAYILYVPVCTVGSMATTAVMGSNGYMPTVYSVIVISVTTFVVILPVVAAILRRCLKQPVTVDDSDIVSTTPSDVVAPPDDPTHE